MHYLGCLLEDNSSWCNGATGDSTQSQRNAGPNLSHLSDEMVQLYYLLLCIFFLVFAMCYYIFDTQCNVCKFYLQFDSRISEASTFVQKLRADTSHDVARCPYLANVEIERLKLLHGKNNEDELMEALVQYFLRYSMSFFSMPIFYMVVIIEVYI